MKEDIKRQWIERLRDPEAKQTRATLGRPDGGRCCLGVLCDIAVAVGVISPPTEVPNSATGEHVLSYHGEEGVLPPAVRVWAGLSSSTPVIAVPDKTRATKTRYYSLVELNDGALDGAVLGALTFSQIADLIEWGAVEYYEEQELRR